MVASAGPIAVGVYGSALAGSAVAAANRGKQTAVSCSDDVHLYSSRCTPADVPCTCTAAHRSSVGCGSVAGALLGPDLQQAPADRPERGYRSGTGNTRLVHTDSAFLHLARRQCWLPDGEVPEDDPGISAAGEYCDHPPAVAQVELGACQ